MKNMELCLWLAMNICCVSASFAINEAVDTQELKNLYSDIQKKLEATTDEQEKDVLQKQLTALDIEMIHEESTTKEQAPIIEQQEQLIESEPQKNPIEDTTKINPEFIDLVNNIELQHEIYFYQIFTCNRLDEKDTLQLELVKKTWKKLIMHLRDEIAAYQTVAETLGLAQKDLTTLISEVGFSTVEPLLDLGLQVHNKCSNLQQFVAMLKHTRIVFELLTIGQGISTDSLVQTTLSLAEYQHIFLATYTILLQELDTCIQKKDILDKNVAPKTICRLIPQHLIGGTLSRFLSLNKKAWQAAMLHSIIWFNDETIDALPFWDHYFSFINRCNATCFGCINTDGSSLLTDYNLVFSQALRAQESCNKTIYEHVIKNIVDKLCTLHKKLEGLDSIRLVAPDFFQSFVAAQATTQKKDHDIDLLVRYRSLLSTRASWFATTHANKETDDVITAFKMVTDSYLNQRITSVQPTFLMLVLQTLKQLRTLRSFEQGFISHLVWGTSATAAAMDDMISILISIENHLRSYCTEKTTSIPTQIMSSGWWKTLSQKSPLLVLAALKYVAPYLQGTLSETVTSFLASQDRTKPQQSQNNLFTFIEQHPKVFDDLCAKYPKFLDLVATRLQN